MFWDDGESIAKDFGTYNYLHFDYFVNVTNDKMELVAKCTHGYDSEEKVKLPTLNTIEILGYPFSPDWDSARLNGEDVYIGPDFSNYTPSKRILKIDVPKFIDLNKNGPVWTLIWNNKMHEFSNNFLDV
ncbi:Acid Alpha Glucosidase Relate [Ditylenchus destructor]|nr:Acid Alpha Glucosidase Relate [Ditylenchus destructor]